MYGWEIVGGFQCARIDCVLCCSIALQHHQFNRRKRFVYVRTYTKLTACGWTYKLSCSLSNIYVHIYILYRSFHSAYQCVVERRKKTRHRHTNAHFPYKSSASLCLTHLLFEYCNDRILMTYRSRDSNIISHVRMAIYRCFNIGGIPDTTTTTHCCLKNTLFSILMLHFIDIWIDLVNALAFIWAFVLTESK